MTIQGIDFQGLIDDADRDGVQRLVVGAVIHAGGQVLILRRSTDDACRPGVEELPPAASSPAKTCSPRCGASAPKRSAGGARR